MKLFRSDVYENLKMALDTLRANKLRSLLTVVGVVIGVWTVMAIASIISGIDETVKREIESFGTRSIYITKFDPGIHTGRRSRELPRTGNGLLGLRRPAARGEGGRHHHGEPPAPGRLPAHGSLLGRMRADRRPALGLAQGRIARLTAATASG